MVIGTLITHLIGALKGGIRALAPTGADALCVAIYWTCASFLVLWKVQHMLLQIMSCFVVHPSPPPHTTLAGGEICNMAWNDIMLYNVTWGMMCRWWEHKEPGASHILWTPDNGNKTVWLRRFCLRWFGLRWFSLGRFGGGEKLGCEKDAM